MEQYISGVIKDISFHELFVIFNHIQISKLRKENVMNILFDPDLGFRLINKDGDSLISGYELQGYLE